MQSSDNYYPFHIVQDKHKSFESWVEVISTASSRMLRLTICLSNLWKPSRYELTAQANQCSKQRQENHPKIETCSF